MDVLIAVKLRVVVRDADVDIGFVTLKLVCPAVDSDVKPSK